MEEITIKNFLKRTPHIKTLHDVHLYAIYVYAITTGVYRSDDPEKKEIPFSDSKEEIHARIMLVDEAMELCNSLNKSYVEEMGQAVIDFRNMTAGEKSEVLQSIF